MKYSVRETNCGLFLNRPAKLVCRVNARARNFVLEHKMFALEHELRARARSISCSSTKCCARAQSTSCSSTKYSCSSTNSSMSEQELDRARAQISCSTTNILCSTTKFRARPRTIIARAEK